MPTTTFTLSPGILTTLLNTFIATFSAGYSRLSPDAWSLLSMLAILEIVVAGMWWALTDDNALIGLLRKVMQIGFFIFLVERYTWLIEIVEKGFVYTGLKAGGAATTSTSLLKDPSAIIKYGFKAVSPMLKEVDSYSKTDQLWHLPYILMQDFAIVLVLMAFFIIAIVVVITYLEFYLVSVLGLILLPFGVFKHTAFLAERVFGAVVSYGIRLMVLAFILSATNSTMANLGLYLAAHPGFMEGMLIFLVAATLAALAWHSPAVASGLIAGSPSLTMGTVAGTTIAMAGGAAAGTAAITAATMAVGSAGYQATKSAAGYISEKWGGHGGGGGGAGSQLAYDGFTNTMGPKTTRANASPPSARKESTGTGGHSPSPAAKSGMPAWATALLVAQRSTPPETHPGAAVSVPIRHE